MLGTLDDPAPSPRKATFASARVSARRSGTDCRSAEAPSPIVFFFRQMSERGPLTSRDLIGDSDHGSRTVAGRGSHRRIAHDQVVRAWSRHAERAVLFLMKIPQPRARCGGKAIALGGRRRSTNSAWNTAIESRATLGVAQSFSSPARLDSETRAHEE